MKKTKNRNMFETKNIDSVPEMRGWITEVLFDEGPFGSYKDYMDGWMWIRERLDYEFNERQKKLCSEAISQLLRELRKDELKWSKEYVDDLLLLAESYEQLNPPVFEEIRLLAEKGGFEDTDLQRRLLQALLYTREHMSVSFWNDMLKRDSQEFAAHALVGILYNEGLKSGFKVLDKFDVEEEINLEKTHELRMYNSIRGLLSNKEFTRKEVLSEARKSKEYLSSKAFNRIQRALPEMNE